VAAPEADDVQRGNASSRNTALNGVVAVGSGQWRFRSFSPDMAAQTARPGPTKVWNAFSALKRWPLRRAHPTLFQKRNRHWLLDASIVCMRAGSAWSG